MEIEICRLVFMENNDGKSWWEARQTISGKETVIFRGNDYFDQYSKRANSLIGAFWQMSLMSSEKFDEELKRHEEQKRASNLNLVAQLSSYSWESMTFDDRGLVSSLKRVKPNPALENTAKNRSGTSQKTTPNRENEERKIIIKCENCGQKLSIPLRKKNLHVACPKCRYEFNYEYVEGNPVDD